MTDDMRYVRQAGNDPAFLRKALNEVGGELRNGLYGYSRRDLLKEADSRSVDDGWCLMGIALHLLIIERGVSRQFEAIIHDRDPEIRFVDWDDIPLREDVLKADEDDILDEYHYLRRHNTYQLWELDERHWQRAGIHPYQGRVTLLDISRELYRHDLEHLWQMHRMLENFTGARRR